jgi:hypothetical protein
MSLFSLLFRHKGFRAPHVQIVSISLAELRQQISQICHTMILLKVIRPKENSCDKPIHILTMIHLLCSFFSDSSSWLQALVTPLYHPSLHPSLQQNSSKTTASRARKQSGNRPTNLLPLRFVFSWFVSPLHTSNSMENNTSSTKISARKKKKKQKKKVLHTKINPAKERTNNNSPRSLFLSILLLTKRLQFPSPHSSFRPSNQGTDTKLKKILFQTQKLKKKPSKPKKSNTPEI